LQQQAVKDEKQFHIDSQKLEIEKTKTNAELQIAHEESAVRLVEAQTERYAKNVDYELKSHDMKHRHMKEAIETHHSVSQ